MHSAGQSESLQRHAPTLCERRSAPERAALQVAKPRIAPYRRRRCRQAAPIRQRRLKTASMTKAAHHQHEEAAQRSMQRVPSKQHCKHGRRDKRPDRSDVCVLGNGCARDRWTTDGGRSSSGRDRRVRFGGDGPRKAMMRPAFGPGSFSHVAQSITSWAISGLDDRPGCSIWRVARRR